jgi:ribosomal protein S18 acetylase RimI-like enzyme/mannose-6-phosphate isomerase-like protein (cupin superfamily)
VTEMLSVRQLDQNDVDAWVSIRLEALEAHPLAFGASVPDNPQVLLDTARERLAPRDESAVFGAFEEDQLVGIVGIKRHEGAKERHKAYIWGMYVSAKSRRHGAGSILLSEAIGRARAWPGVEHVLLSVSILAEDAKHLYERHGFRTWGREPSSLRWDGRSVDEHHMVLDLRAPVASADSRERPAIAPSRAMHVSLASALAKGEPPPGNLAVPILAHGSLEVELYAPRGRDPQKPHSRDEIYVVANGEGMFFDGTSMHAVQRGSFVFVPAGQEHRFEQFSSDFTVWAFFYGPEGGEAPLRGSV